MHGKGRKLVIPNGVPAIISWKVRHLRGLFPDLEVQTPVQWSAASK